MMTEAKEMNDLKPGDLISFMYPLEYYMIPVPKRGIPAGTPILLLEVITEDLNKIRKSFLPERRLVVDISVRLDPVYCTVIIFWEGVPMHVLQAKRKDICVLS
jgi:hypothetical protein